MNYLDALRDASNRKDLARILGFKPSALTSIVYKTPLEEKYTTFEIPKKNGGVRIIKAPKPKLKRLQKHLAHQLNGCLFDIEEKRDVAPVSYGFRKNGKITENAKLHKRKRFVLNLDLEDFFPSFHFGRVRGFFLKDKRFELEEEVATTIAQIACDGTALPQGSPASPIISELIGQVLDLRLLRLAKKYNVYYSRYADDITFSTNLKTFPEALAVQDPVNLSKWNLGEELCSKIENSGFTINSSKTRMQCRGNRQTVTGLVVNEKVNIKSDYYRKTRAMCDSLFQTGQYYTSVVSTDENDSDPEPDKTSNLNFLEGRLSYIYSVTQSEDRRDVSDQRTEPRAIRKLYRRFLFYKQCIALDAPLVITEGKTDPVYLREAIKRRNVFQPLLGCPKDGYFEFGLRFFNYEGQSHEIMDLGGGTSDLRSIPMDYLRNIDSKKVKRKPFSHKPMEYPVILVLDNDDGLKGIVGTIKKNFNVAISISSTEKYYRITNNLYLVKTPEKFGKSCIEDLFPKVWLEKELNGKKFSTGQIDVEKEYGKEVFARAVIRPNANKIDFSGFDPLLERIAAVIEDYSPP